MTAQMECERRLSRCCPIGGRQLLLVSSLGALLQFNTNIAFGSGVEANATTPTSVTVDASGRSSIVPALPVHDVSYNAFNSFDVATAGALFLNAGVNARTIVAEVLSASPSRIEGPVSVVGPRANLILANQNGIRVNGGSFVNFGSVALTTGTVTLRDLTLAPGYTQRYVDVDTRAGDIQVESGGLAADLIHLEFIAKRIGIGGPVTNAYTSPTAVTRVVAGNSKAQFDTAASPTDNLTPWVYYSSDSGATSGISVDIEASSKVSSGRIEIIVTDQGAGVRNAGDLLASAGDFILTSTGRVEQLGGQIGAAGNIRINADEFAQTNRDDHQSSVASSSNVRIDTSSDIKNIGGVIRGEARDTTQLDTPYAVMLNAGGLIEHRTEPGGQGAIIYGAQDDVGLFAHDGVISIDARVISNGALRIETNGLAQNETSYTAGAGRLDWAQSNPVLLGLFERKKSGYTVDLGTLADPDHLAYWVADGDLTVKAADVKNIGGFIFSNNGNAQIEADREVEIRALSVGTFSYRRSCLLFICKQEASSSEKIVGGQINASGRISIVAGGRIVNDGGNVFAIGDVNLDAPEIIAHGRPLHTAILRDKGLKALFGDTWAKIYANDQGGGFTAQQGQIFLHGTAIQDRGYYAAGKGIEGDIQVVEAARREPVTIEDHLGILFW